MTRTAGLDAVVVGDYERAFGAVSEFGETVLLAGRHGVRAWMPRRVVWSRWTVRGFRGC